MIHVAYVLIGLIGLGLIFCVLRGIAALVDFIGGFDTLVFLFILFLIFGGAYGLGQILFKLF